MDLVHSHHMVAAFVVHCPTADCSRLNVFIIELLFQNEEVPGYTRSLNNQWLYSQAAIDVVDTYAEKFPRLFEMMDQQTNAQTDPIFESDLCDGQKVSSISPSLAAWLEKYHKSHLTYRKGRRVF